MPKLKQVILTNFPFENNLNKSVIFHNFKISNYSFLSFLRMVLSNHFDILFISQPSFKILIAILFLKTLMRPASSVVYYDLILQRPTNILDRVIARLKSILLNQADYFYFLHRDIYGYIKYYSLNANKARYIPYKANNMKFVDKIVPEDHGYIFSAGVSHRDYNLLFSAIGELGYKCKVIIPQSRIGIHNTVFTQDNVPSNIEIITSDVDQYTWNELLAKSRIVVLPILKDVLQPAGISVCLEAMAFGKPVVINKGTSVNGLITEQEVELYEASDKESLKHAVNKIWHDTKRREKISKNGKLYAMSLGDNKDLQHRLVNQITIDHVITYSK